MDFKNSILIKGVEWKYRVLTEKAFKHIHPDSEAQALTVSSEMDSGKPTFYMDFIDEALSLETVRHEVFHAFIASCCIHNCTDLKPEDMEEVCATVVEVHWADIDEAVTEILTALTEDEDE